MTTTHALMTAEELLQLPDTGQRYELVRGELHTMSPASHQHGRIAGKIIVWLGTYVQAHQLGEVYAAETGFVLAHDPDTVRAPDVAFVRRERVEAAMTDEGYFPGAPDLAIEVISPDDRYTEVEEKVTDWLDAGSQMMIVLNPRQRRRMGKIYRSATLVTTLTIDDTLDGEDVVPGWTLPVRDLFTR